MTTLFPQVELKNGMPDEQLNSINLKKLKSKGKTQEWRGGEGIKKDYQNSN